MKFARMLALVPALLIALAITLLVPLGASAYDGETPSPSPTYIDIPSMPGVNDPCNPSTDSPTNVEWVQPPNDEQFNWQIDANTRQMVVTIVPPNTVFSGTNDQTWYGFDLPADSGVVCEPDPIELEVPVFPVNRLCGADNDYYVLGNLPRHIAVRRNIDRSVTLIADAGYTFSNNRQQVVLSPPKDDGTACWNAFEKRAMRGICITGHRGMGKGIVRFRRKSYDEDTVGSLTKAMSLGACSVETDYQETKDKNSVSQHDPTLDRMTNGSGRIARRNLGYMRGLRGPSGSRVATHYGMVKSLAKNKRSCFQQQEIKQGGFSDFVMRRMINTNLQLLKRPDCVIFTSSERRTLGQVNKIDDRFQTGLIIRRTNSCVDIGSLSRQIDRIMCDWRSLSPGYVRRAEAAGFDVSARNVDDWQTFRRVKRWGVGYVVTDHVWLLARRYYGGR